MAEVNGEQLDQTNVQETARDQFYLFTPVSDINCRVNPKDYIDFVGTLEDTISAHCRNYDPDDTLSFQIGCALLPGGRKLIELEFIPKESPTFHARQLGEVIILAHSTIKDATGASSSEDKIARSHPSSRES